nr:hypothetical protein Iba_chr15aCG11890 [Ipomoea batatas]GMD99037.1 hypothetical protein Iba_chr15dCG8560 [Ipomoea batatas]
MEKAAYWQAVVPYLGNWDVTNDIPSYGQKRKVNSVKAGRHMDPGLGFHFLAPEFSEFEDFLVGCDLPSSGVENLKPFVFAGGKSKGTVEF